MGKFGTLSFVKPDSGFFVGDLLSSSNFSLHFESEKLFEIPDIAFFNADGDVCDGFVKGVLVRRSRKGSGEGASSE